jgi:hypothetical protein
MSENFHYFLQKIRNFHHPIIFDFDFYFEAKKYFRVRIVLVIVFNFDVI